MSIINGIINVLRFGIIPVATTLRCIFCLIKLIYDNDDHKTYKRRLANTIIFSILSELVFVIKDIIEYYY